MWKVLLSLSVCWALGPLAYADEVSATSFLILAKSITAAGTPEQVDSYGVPEGMPIVVTARLGNTQNCYLANSSANALATNRKVLTAGQSTTLQVWNTNLFWFDCDNTSDVLEFTIQQTPGSGGS